MFCPISIVKFEDLIIATDAASPLQYQLETLQADYHWSLTI